MMTKKIISIIFAIVLVFGLSVCAYAEEQRFVFDEASILTYDEMVLHRKRAYKKADRKPPAAFPSVYDLILIRNSAP